MPKYEVILTEVYHTYVSYEVEAEDEGDAVFKASELHDQDCDEQSATEKANRIQPQAGGLPRIGSYKRAAYIETEYFDMLDNEEVREIG